MRICLNGCDRDELYAINTQDVKCEGNAQCENEDPPFEWSISAIPYYKLLTAAYSKKKNGDSIFFTIKSVFPEVYL